MILPKLEFDFRVLTLKLKKLSLSSGSGSGGRISWDRNSTFSGGRIFDHEIEIQFVHDIKFFCKIDQEIELARGALRELG